jgi:hypothetical protein
VCVCERERGRERESERERERASERERDCTLPEKNALSLEEASLSDKQMVRNFMVAIATAWTFSEFFI